MTDATQSAESTNSNSTQAPEHQHESTEHRNGDNAPHESTEPDEVKGLRAAVAAERRKRQQLETDIDKLRKAQMSESEKAMAEAKAEGRKAALSEVSSRLLAAEVRAVAADRMADPADAVHLLDLDGLVDDEGTVDTKALIARIDALLVDKPYLAKSGAARAAAAKAPQGARPDGGGDRTSGDNFIRTAVKRRRAG